MLLKSIILTIDFHKSLIKINIITFGVCKLSKATHMHEPRVNKVYKISKVLGKVLRVHHIRHMHMKVIIRLLGNKELMLHLPQIVRPKFPTFAFEPSSHSFF